MNLNKIIKLAYCFEKQARTDDVTISEIREILGNVTVKKIGQAFVDSGDLVVADPIYMDEENNIVKLKTGGDGGFNVYELAQDGKIEGYFIESVWPIDSE